MSRILVMSQNTRTADVLRLVLEASGHAIQEVNLESVSHWESLFITSPVLFVCVEKIEPSEIALVERVRRAGAQRIFIVCNKSEILWEESVLLAGAERIFECPLRANLILSFIERNKPKPAAPLTPVAAVAPVEQFRSRRQPEPLVVLRDFSRLLAHAGDAPIFLNEFIRRLRELLSVNKALLYLRSPKAEDWRCAAIVGTDTVGFKEFKLSTQRGLGSLLQKTGHVAFRDRMEASDASEARAEMEVFGADIAVPLMGGEGFSGILLLGPRITGAPLADDEVILVHLLMEELAAAIRVNDLQLGLARERKLYSFLLSNLPFGCLVIDSNLDIQQANPRMLDILGVSKVSLEFNDLPAEWARVLFPITQGKSETGVYEVDFETSRRHRLFVYRLQIEGLSPLFAVFADDLTQSVETQKKAVELALLSVTIRLGERLADEIRNAIIPIFTWAQMLPKTEDSDQVFRAIHRLLRRADELSYLQTATIRCDSVPIADVWTAIRSRLEKDVGERLGAVRLELTAEPETVILADSRAIAFGVSELVTNSIEAGAKDISVTFSLWERGTKWVLIVKDDGPGGAFFGVARGTKAQGLGLGLESVQQIVMAHGGKVELLAEEKQGQTVQLVFPTGRGLRNFS